MDNLTERLLDPVCAKRALQEIEAYVPTDEIDDGPTAHITALAKAVAELHARLRTAKKYAAAPVDKGIPMHIYRAVCEQRDHELAERQRMTHRYEVEALRNKELEEQLATAKAEGAAEEAQKFADLANNVRRTAAIRKGLEAKRDTSKYVKPLPGLRLEELADDDDYDWASPVDMGDQ